ncbi:MAG: hypothetical protein GY928_26660, partial [Colwellia sp.]|nr:hypothetical protein [Colwellia sp.]
RGFTNHEMLDDVDIIHMNGRIYDGRLGRFLQADPHIQDPSNSQSLNRYSYVINNPLSYTDPTGYNFLKKIWNKIRPFVGIIVAVVASIVCAGTCAPALIGALAGAAGAAANGGNIIQGAVIGAFSAGAFGEVGSTLNGGDFGSAAYFGKVAVHGIVGGMMSVMQGGKFGHGFASAGVTQSFAKAIDTIDKGNNGISVGRSIAAAVVGGTASTLSGGKFANGAMTGAFSRIFNDDIHDNPPEYEEFIDIDGDVVVTIKVSLANNSVGEYACKLSSESCSYTVGGIKDKASVKALTVRVNSKIQGEVQITTITIASNIKLLEGGITASSNGDVGLNIRMSRGMLSGSVTAKFNSKKVVTNGGILFSNVARSGRPFKSGPFGKGVSTDIIRLFCPDC